jgi:hypothetical protein
MNTALNTTGNDKSQTTGTKQDTQKEEVQISLPQIDRPEGPFEHSGETSGWTKEEEAEKEQEQK